MDPNDFKVNKTAKKSQTKPKKQNASSGAAKAYVKT
jgi:hypothetical protein